MLARTPLEQQKFQALFGTKLICFLSPRWHLQTRRGILPNAALPSLPVSASLLSAARRFAGFAFAKPWPAALLGWDLLAELPLKAKEGGEPSSAQPHG